MKSISKQGSGIIKFNTQENISVKDLERFIVRLQDVYLTSKFLFISNKSEDFEVWNKIRYSQTGFNDLFPAMDVNANVLISHVNYNNLVVKRIVINSPGLLEFIGDLNPINLIKDIYKQFNEQKRWRAEFELKKIESEQLFELNRIEIIRKKIELLREVGVDKEEINGFIQGAILVPASNLVIKSSKFVLEDNGRVKAPEQKVLTKKNKEIVVCKY